MTVFMSQMMWNPWLHNFRMHPRFHSSFRLLRCIPFGGAFKFHRLDLQPMRSTWIHQDSEVMKYAMPTSGCNGWTKHEWNLGQLECISCVSFNLAVSLSTYYDISVSWGCNWNECTLLRSSFEGPLLIGIVIYIWSYYIILYIAWVKCPDRIIVCSFLYNMPASNGYLWSVNKSIESRKCSLE